MPSLSNHKWTEKPKIAHRRLFRASKDDHRRKTAAAMSLVAPDPNAPFQHILRLLNTNVDGKRSEA
jgi:hypothetical protein